MLRQLSILRLYLQVYIVHQKHLHNLEVVTFGCQMEARAASWMDTVQVGVLDFQQDVDDSRIAIPASNFDWKPAVHL